MIAIVLTAVLASGPAVASQEQPALQCNLGPTTEQVGGGNWIVYGCADGKSVVVVAATPNPAAPFIFIVTPDGNGVQLHGEGTGPKSATDPAYEQLKSMSAQQLKALYNKAAGSNGR